MARPSVYLKERCETFSKLLDYFFVSGKCVTINERLITFLYQIDFWDWEIENLIFSFDNFEERSKAWIGDVSSTAVETSMKHGFPLRTNLVNFWRNWIRRGNNEVVSPRDDLNKVVTKWNELLTLAEKKVFLSEKTVKSLIDLGGQFVPNLDKYRKAGVYEKKFS